MKGKQNYRTLKPPASGPGDMLYRAKCTTSSQVHVVCGQRVWTPSVDHAIVYRAVRFLVVRTCGLGLLGFTFTSEMFSGTNQVVPDLRNCVQLHWQGLTLNLRSSYGNEYSSFTMQNQSLAGPFMHR